MSKKPHGNTGAIRVKKSESMVVNGVTYVTTNHISRVFDGRSKRAIQSIDKDKRIVHPTKGVLIAYPGKVIRVEG